MIENNNLIEQYLLNFKEKKSLNDYSYKCYKKDIISFSNFINKPFDQLNEDDFILYIQNEEKNNRSINTINRRISSINPFIIYLDNNKIINKKLIKPKYKKIVINDIIYLNHEEEKLFIESFKNNGFITRNYLMILLLLNSGLKINELLHLKTYDIDYKKRTLAYKIGWRIKKEIELSNKTIEELTYFINKVRIIQNTNINNQYLFLNNNGQLLSRQYIFKIINEKKEILKIDKKINTNVLRNTFIMNCLRNNLNLKKISYLLGIKDWEALKPYKTIFEIKEKNLI